MNSYMGVKLLQAEPMTLGEYNKHRGWDIPADEDPKKSGYRVEYPQPDGSTYQSWSPLEVFEDAYLPLSDPTSIRSEEVVAMLGPMTADKLDEKTTHVKAECLTGFVQHEVSSCVDPANYDHQIGVEIGTKRIKDRVWMCMGFVLQWAKYGLKGK